MLSEKVQIELRNARYGWQNATSAVDVLYFLREYARVRWLIACRLDNKRGKRRAAWWRKLHRRVEEAFFRTTRDSYLHEHAFAQSFDYVPACFPRRTFRNDGNSGDNSYTYLAEGRRLSRKFVRIVQHPHCWAETIQEFDTDSYGWVDSFRQKLFDKADDIELQYIENRHAPPKRSALAVCIGDRLTHYRKQAGLSQKDLADLLNTTESYVWLLENGRKSPTLATLRELSDLYGVSGHLLMLPMPPEKDLNNQRG